jgi:hypothetical protein
MKLQLKVMIGVLAVVGFVAVQSAGAAETWTGKISDAMCGASHGANGGTMAKDHDCAVKCAKGGSAYVFVNAADKKIYKIANQKLPALEVHAGHDVMVTGDLKGDTITVTKVEMKKG